MILAADLCEKFSFALADGWGYIFGRSGQTWTQAAQDAATREQTVKWGQRWVGHRVADCSGMFVWAYRQLEGPKIYHGSNTIWRSWCTMQGKLRDGKRCDGYKLRPGTAVFLCDSTGNRHHIGLYIGGDVCIEAKGTYYGVVTSKPSHWDEWGELKDVDYSAFPEEKEGDAVHPTLRKGDRGDDVRDLQILLNAEGARLTPDGAFGSATEQAVKAFQEAHKLKPDGIVGPATWAVLDPKPSAPELPEDPDDEPVGIVAMPYEEALRIKGALDEALGIIKKYLG